MEKKQRIRRFVVCVDGNGHFHVVNASNRERVIRVLKKIEDGDFWTNEAESYYGDDNKLFEITNRKWFEFLTSLQTRGRMEVVDINKKL